MFASVMKAIDRMRPMATFAFPSVRRSARTENVYYRMCASVIQVSAKRWTNPILQKRYALPFLEDRTTLLNSIIRSPPPRIHSLNAIKFHLRTRLLRRMRQWELHRTGPVCLSGRVRAGRQQSVRPGLSKALPGRSVYSAG